VNIESLKTAQHMEYKAYAAFASRLMTGVTVGDRYLQLSVNNRPRSQADAAKFKIDAVLTLDGEEIGVLDVERKTGWSGGNWPYRQINFPYKPFADFENGIGSPRSFSSKARELYKAWTEGRPAFWVAYSSPIADSTGQQMLVSRQACLVLPADRIFGDEYEIRLDSQPTRYGRDVKVIVIPNEAGIVCTSEIQFTDVIVSAVDAWIKSQEVTT